MSDRQQILVWAATTELVLAHESNSALSALERIAAQGSSDGSRGLLLGVGNLLTNRALAELHRLEQAA